MRNLLSIILLLTTFAIVPQTNNTKLIGQWGYGPTYAMAAQGNILYSSSGTMFVAYDITNPSAPQKLSATGLKGKIRAITINNSKAYVAASEAGLYIIDISNPANPVVLGSYAPLATATGVAVTGNTAYLACGLKGYAIIDISNPADPAPVQHPFSSLDDYRSVYVSGQLLLVLRYNKGFDIYDISNPQLPSAKGTFVAQTASDLSVQGSYAYLTKLSGGLRIINISDPLNPVEAGFYNAGQAAKIYTTVSFAFIGCGESGLKIINISNPSSPTLSASYNNVNDAGLVCVVNNCAVFNDVGQALKILDVSALPSVTLKSSIRTYGSSAYCIKRENLLYVSSGNSGFSVIDVSNPQNPQEVGFYDSPGLASCFTLSGNYAYLADGYNFRIIDISNSSSPVLKGVLYMGAPIHQIAVSGTLAYIANNFNGLKIVDISNPASPTAAGTFTLTNQQQIGGVTVYNNYLYISDISGSNNGVKIVSRLNPTQPVLSGSIDGINAMVKNFRIIDDSVYFNSVGEVYHAGLLNPSAPSPVKSHSFANLNDYSFNGEYVYGASARDKLQILLNYRYYNMLPVGSYITPGECLGVISAGNLIYVADGECGIQIIQNTLISTAVDKNTIAKPEGVTLWQNYPNPFNPSTAISYYLEKRQLIKLKIYDALGREIAVLANGEQDAGTHTVNFLTVTGMNLASGLYVYQLETAAGKISKKMMLLK